MANGTKKQAKPKTPQRKTAAKGTKHAGGRPPKFDNPQTMGKKIDEYFKSCRTKSGRWKSGVPPTIAGLALALGFLDRRSVYDYSERSEEFSHAVKKARLIIESYHEAALSRPACTGPIFWLKNNAEYADKTEFTGPRGGPIEIANLTPEERKARIAQLLAKASK